MGMFDWLFGNTRNGQVPTSNGHDIELPVEHTAAVTPSDACIALIKRQEGFRDTAYPDYNGYAIGYGSHEVDGVPVVKGQKIDLAGADRACRRTAGMCAVAVRTLTKPSLRQLRQHELDALTDFVYNAGVGALQSSTLLRTINSHGIVTEDMFTRWNKVHDPDTGEVREHPGLTARRQAEFQLWTTP